MLRLNKLSEHKAFGGQLTYYQHASFSTKTNMKFAAFIPPVAPKKTLIWLSGLTCTEENFVTKSCALSHAARLGVALIACDTSPRGTNLPGEHDDWTFGSGAGYYIDATQDPWSSHYQMASYVTKELVDIIRVDLGLTGSLGIFGHSMGGHGALVLGMKNQNLFSSLSAFAPITALSEVPWGQKALSRFLGENREEWHQYDACRVVEKLQGYPLPILIDQGTNDQAIEMHLKPELFEEACRKTHTALMLNYRDGYDHGYFFVASFIHSHLEFHLSF